MCTSEVRCFMTKCIGNLNLSLFPEFFIISLCSAREIMLRSMVLVYIVESLVVIFALLPRMERVWGYDDFICTHI